MSPGRLPRRRADPLPGARRTHEQICCAARTAFGELGADVPWTSSRRADVGNATLYRRFPSRELLVEAVHREDTSRLTDAALDLADHHSFQEALERWVREGRVPAQQQPGLAVASVGAPEAWLRMLSAVSDGMTVAAEELRGEHAHR
ncbi:TetR/AcrR family transcriptional regulator [Kitasatospora phosalacinea]|uniref:TetR/AcrR family transcriptional regulator n=1 Tax=Kitasatospora phosalacinea TaxID=2065 RepID=UPI003655F38D